MDRDHRRFIAAADSSAFGLSKVTLLLLTLLTVLRRPSDSVFAVEATAVQKLRFAMADELNISLSNSPPSSTPLCSVSLPLVNVQLLADRLTYVSADGSSSSECLYADLLGAAADGDQCRLAHFPKGGGGGCCGRAAENQRAERPVVLSCADAAQAALLARELRSALGVGGVFTGVGEAAAGAGAGEGAQQQRRLRVLVNPFAGGGAATAVWPKLEPLLTAAGFRCVVLVVLVLVVVLVVVVLVVPVVLVLTLLVLLSLILKLLLTAASLSLDVTETTHAGHAKTIAENINLSLG